MKNMLVLCALLVAGPVARTLPYQLDVENHTPSLQVQEGRDPHTGRDSVFIKNTSKQGVLQFCMANPDPYGNIAWNGPVKPGESLEFSSKRFVLKAALFADGSYEGDPIIAAQMAQAYIGKLVQFERIEKRVDGPVSAPGSDADRREAILQSLKELRDEPDATLVDRFKKDFPSLAQPDEKHLGYMAQGMNTMRETWLHQLEISLKGDLGMPMAKWWDAIKQRVKEDVLLRDYVPSHISGTGKESGGGARSQRAYLLANEAQSRRGHRLMMRWLPVFQSE